MAEEEVKIEELVRRIQEQLDRIPRTITTEVQSLSKIERRSRRT